MLSIEQIKAFYPGFPQDTQTTIHLLKEYIELLNGPGTASDKFWELEKRIRRDKKAGGVTMRMSRTYMDLNIMSLIADGVIGLDDLEGFSDDLREKMAFIMRE